MKLSRVLNVLFLTFVSFIGLSQKTQLDYPIVSVINSDTVIIFSFEQGKNLAIINENKKRLEKLNDLNNQELLQKDSVIQMQNGQLINNDKIIQKYQFIVKEKENQNELSNSQNTLLKTELKKQIRQKWIAIISGIAGVATISYFYIIK